MDQQQDKQVFHQMTPVSTGKGKLVFLCIVVIGLGILGGYFLAKVQAAKTLSGQATTTASGGTNIQVGAVYGSDDLTTFKDTTEGTVVPGGINGEGQYHLTRPGGDSQNVYMTSSLVDLSLFVNHKVKVWGQTQKAQTAGWLMDVGRVQVEQ